MAAEGIPHATWIPNRPDRDYAQAKADRMLPSRIKADKAIWPVVFLASVVLTFVIYMPAMNAWFVSDDYRWLDDVRWPALLSYLYKSWGHGTAYRPIMRFSFYFDHMFFGENVLGWHSHSYLLHACNAAWLFLILRHLGKRDTFSALVVLLHITSPWVHENVAWISARTHLLASFFYLSSTYMFLRFLKGAGIREPFLLAASIFLFVLGLMTYETTFSLPLLFALMILYLRPTDLASVRKSILVIASYAIVALVFGIYRYYVLGGTLGSTASMHDHLLTGFVTNIGKLIGLFTYHFYVKVSVLCMIIVLGACITSIIYKRSNDLRNIAFASIAGLVLYLPFIMVRGANYRFTYLCQMAFFVLVVNSCCILASLNSSLRRIVSLALVAVCLGNVVNTFTVATEWRAAGNIAKTIVTRFKASHPVLREGFDYMFCNIPDTYYHAKVFRSYFPFAVSRQYNIPDTRVYRYDDWLDGPTEKDWTRPTIYFIYRESSKRMEEVTAEEWWEFRNSRDISGRK